ncbi:LPXTG cell wall anchor domain-containing protein [Candidatus Enterococcus ferrettii]|uniref:Gram-positive cocci surface proteins LPxTG domain-containing protein n=1 Tax=Candidatus Enterococcus ferrettii TaxID=2815324 RepID=A0ABV0EKR6_9ENTE|nr:LPXTG cell wall anchor domain-containing protein [Enterococcus sp. 665A]MBO1340909.1 LPXTG cell wall anchor domain-containing protein [Enterococcus sp. 665A]
MTGNKFFRRLGTLGLIAGLVFLRPPQTLAESKQTTLQITFNEIQKPPPSGGAKKPVPIIMKQPTRTTNPSESLSTSSSKRLPATGEQQSVVITLIGWLALFAWILFYYVGRKRGKKTYD